MDTDDIRAYGGPTSFTSHNIYVPKTQKVTSFFKILKKFFVLIGLTQQEL